MRSGIYQLQCQTCVLSYIGQTGYRLEKKCIDDIRYNTSISPQ
jgi:hypothetical protein